MPPFPLNRPSGSPFAGASALLLRLVFLTLLWGGLLPGEDFQGGAHKLEFWAPPIGYSSAEATDTVSQVVKALGDAAAGSEPYHPKFGYLRCGLKILRETCPDLTAGW